MQFWLQEKEMLQNQLTNTEKMVEDTKNLLEKAKTKSNEHVNKINTLSAELATTEYVNAAVLILISHVLHIIILLPRILLEKLFEILSPSG